jgi:hypothetical protein
MMVSTMLAFDICIWDLGILSAIAVRDALNKLERKLRYFYPD